MTLHRGGTAKKAKKGGAQHGETAGRTRADRPYPTRQDRRTRGYRSYVDYCVPHVTGAKHVLLQVGQQQFHVVTESVLTPASLPATGGHRVR